MKPTNKIRPIALGLIKQGDKYLVFKATEEATSKEFYRPLGGGIKFGEESYDALKREFLEEIDAELINLTLLDVVENIFEYEDFLMHEIVFLYEAELADKKLYKAKSISINDSKMGRVAEWVKRDELLSNNFYPQGIEDFI